MKFSIKICLIGRRIIPVLLFCCSANLSSAVIHTVSNDPQRPAMFTTINAAIMAASAGDTIFVYGSAINYSAADVNKPLYLYGNGSETLANAPATTFGTNQSIAFNPGSSGSVAEGFRFQNDNSDQIIINTSNITVRNCRLSRLRFGDQFSNGVIYNNVFFNSQSSGSVVRCVSNVVGVPSNIEFRNNLFIINNSGAGGINFFTPMNSSVVMNNVFVTWTPASGPVLMANGCTNNVFGNNIFYNLNNVTSTCNFCAFGNNLVHGCTTCDLVSGNQSGSDNLFGNPQFVQYSGTGFDIATDDFDLQPTSPGNLAGSDGTDIGAFGGLYPFTPGTLYNQLLPFQPYITNMTLTNPVIPVQTGGPLQIQAGAIILEDINIVD